MTPFERIVGGLDYPMHIVTAAAGDERDGCLVGFLTQCSIDPPRMVVWLSTNNRTCRIATQSSALCVHVLRQDDHDLAELFGHERGDEVDKLASVEWTEGPHGLPVLARCDWFVGRIVEQISTECDHRGFIVEPIGGDATRSDLPALGYQAVLDIDAGNPA